MKFNFFMGLMAACCLSESALALSEDSRPDYQKEYDAYLQDLLFIEQKGYAPKNSVLDDDLAKMNSEERIRLTHPASHSFYKNSSNQLKLAENDTDKEQAQKSNAEVVDRVEIIRVPEEFREKYADVYAEETKHISTQSLVKQQDENRQKALEDEELLKIAEHDNPFRLLKESELETDLSSLKHHSPKVNSVADAYFQQQKRAYVVDKPIIVKKKEKQQNNVETENVTASETDKEDTSVQNNPVADNPSTKRVSRSSGWRSSSSSSPSHNSFGKASKTKNMFLE